MSTKNHTYNEAKNIFNAEWANLTPQERKLIERILDRISTPRDANQEFNERRTFGERVADLIAAFGGSWTFILIFFTFLLSWAFLNTEFLGPRAEAFDPYPYVFLNLILSMLAAIQAPIIMMTQNRQSARDRIDAEVDHDVNVSAELAIHAVDERVHAVELKLDEALEILRQASK